VDLAGSALLVGAVVSLLLVAEWGGRQYDWDSSPILARIALAGTLTGLFVWWQGRARNPLLPLRLFTNPTLRITFAASAAVGLLLYGSVVFMPTFLQTAYGMSATEAGLALNPYVIPFVAVSALAGGKAGTTGRFKPYLLTGAGTLAAAYLFLSTLDIDSPYSHVAVGMAVLGVGFGLLMQNLVVVTQNAAGSTDLAGATAANLSRGLGMAIGVALFGSLLTREIADRPLTPQTTAEAIPHVFVWGVPLAVLLAVLVALLPRLKPPDRRSFDQPETSGPASRRGTA
jgi:hypothetical protein